MTSGAMTAGSTLPTEAKVCCTNIAPRAINIGDNRNSAPSSQSGIGVPPLPGILILPNPWDAGTAKLLASLGFEALATTSLGMANAFGRADGEGCVSRAELLENCRIIAEATDLPVNADLENGYADDPQEAA